jgi:alanyl-tRNA synthetase
MTERTYYSDPYRRRFTAHVVEELRWEGHPAVILDRTLFYPASGGQPADRGTLDGVRVLDVVEGQADDLPRRDIIHVLSEPITPNEVEGEIVWSRRFDHMQQHTGQHVLSAAFEQVLDADTVGFHLGEQSSTIDVDAADLDMEAVLPVESLANEVIWDDRPVDARFVDEEAAAGLPAEALPDVSGRIRLVEIPGAPGATEGPFDLNPCGGTHVARTGEIGIVKIVGVEHRGDETRVEFLCGERALRDYEAKRSMTARLGGMLTVGTWELDEAVGRLQEENKELRHSERRLQQRLLEMESTQLLETAATYGRYRVVGAVWEQRSPRELQSLARKLAEHSDVVALLFGINDRVHLCFARAETLDLDVNVLLQKACGELGGKGGGRPQVAQGSAPRADRETIESVLRDLKAALAEEA